jgi:hypothetical protein
MTNNRWTNQDNFLYRVFADGTEEQCDYAGITHLTSAKEGSTTIPCAYCGQTIPGTAGNCTGCGGPRIALVTQCSVQIEAMLPDGGRLMDYPSPSILEVRKMTRSDWPESPYFSSGGLSTRSIGWEPPKYQEWFPQQHVAVKDIKGSCAKEVETSQTIIRLSEFNLNTLFIDSPVLIEYHQSCALSITMMLECKAEFFFGERK